MTSIVEEPSAGPQVTRRKAKASRTGPSGCLSNTVIAIASVAPAYSLAAALAFVVLAVNLQAPIVMLLAFVPMLFIAIGYQQLNRPMPDCGTTFTWGTKAFGPKIGWMGGWGIIAADVIVMANLAQIAASYTFTFFGAYGLAASKWWTLLGRRDLDHPHVRHLLHRHRDRRRHPVWPARDRAGHARSSSASPPWEGVRAQRPAG